MGIDCGSSLQLMLSFKVKRWESSASCFSLSLYCPVSGSATRNIRKKNIRRIEKRQVEGPENATCLLERDTIWERHEPKIDKLWCRD